MAARLSYTCWGLEIMDTSQSETLLLNGPILASGLAVPTSLLGCAVAKCAILVSPAFPHATKDHQHKNVHGKRKGQPKAYASAALVVSALSFYRGAASFSIQL